MTDSETILGLDMKTAICLAVVASILFIVAVGLIATFCAHICRNRREREMDNSSKQVHLKKRFLHQLKKEAKEMSKTHRRPNILRVISIRSENKENTLPDAENNVPVEDNLAECTICLEKFSGNTTNINIGLLISCGHYYHFECLWEWLRTHLSCPVCRHEVQWSERQIRAVTYAKFLEDTSQQNGISFVPRREEDTHSVTSIESLEYSGCFPRFSSRVLPAVHQAWNEQNEQRAHRIPRMFSLQETISDVTLAQVLH